MMNTTISTAVLWHRTWPLQGHLIKKTWSALWSWWADIKHVEIVLPDL